MQFTEKQVRDFWAKVRVAADAECWEWTGARNPKGYGVKRNAVARGVKENIMAHRMSWLLFNSDIPEGLRVLHKCDNPSCVNPAHLFLGTPKDNTQDMLAKGRGVSPPLAPLKFAPEQAAEIRMLSASGRSFRELARAFGTTHNVIRSVVYREGRYAEQEN